MKQQRHDQAWLLLCEDLTNVLVRNEQIEAYRKEHEDDPSIRRLKNWIDALETERRLIEEVSLPCRFMLEHLSVLLHNKNYTIGFQSGCFESGRGILHKIEVGPWGTVHLWIGDMEISWRDAEVSYLFYQDKVIVRHDSGRDDLSFHFNYGFKLALRHLQRFQDVAFHEQTKYWHEDLVVREEEV